MHPMSTYSHPMAAAAEQEATAAQASRVEPVHLAALAVPQPVPGARAGTAAAAAIPVVVQAATAGTALAFFDPSRPLPHPMCTSGSGIPVQVETGARVEMM